MSLAVPFDMISEQKRDEAKPTSPTHCRGIELLVKTPVRPALIFWHFVVNDSCAGRHLPALPGPLDPPLPLLRALKVPNLAQHAFERKRDSKRRRGGDRAVFDRRGFEPKFEQLSTAVRPLP